MASKAHQLIATCIIRKMREKKYEVVAFEGDYTKVSTIPFKLPLKILRHRPDVIGVDQIAKRICIGEAKTTDDLYSARTKEQLSDYATLLSDNISDISYEIILGIPKVAVDILERILAELELKENNRIEILSIPEVLFTDENEI